MFSTNPKCAAFKADIAMAMQPNTWLSTASWSENAQRESVTEENARLLTIHNCLWSTERAQHPEPTVTPGCNEYYLGMHNAALPHSVRGETVIFLCDTVDVYSSAKKPKVGPYREQGSGLLHGSMPMFSSVKWRYRLCKTFV